MLCVALPTPPSSHAQFSSDSQRFGSLALHGFIVWSLSVILIRTLCSVSLNTKLENIQYVDRIITDCYNKLKFNFQCSILPSNAREKQTVRIIYYPPN